MVRWIVLLVALPLARCASALEFVVADASRDALKKEVEDKSAMLRRTREATRAEGLKLLAVFDILPPTLKTPLQGLAERVRGVLEVDANVSAPERLRLLTTFAGSLHGALNSSHAGKQMVKVGDEPEREMDVLFLGAAAGYYVSPGDRRAGLLTRDAEGWHAEPRNEIAGDVREAIAIIKKERPARFISLPLPRADGKEAP